jgi:hypothetical protein
LEILPMNKTKLLALSEREFQRQTGEPVALPVDKRFRAMSLKLSRFDGSWDKKRGSAIRLTGVLLTESDEAMQRRVCASEATAKTYGTAVSWLSKESEHLRKAAKMHDLAVARLSAVLARCNGEAAHP